MKRFIVPVLFVLALPLSSEDFTLSRAVERACSVSHELRAKQAKVERLQEEKKEALTRYFPRLTLNASYTHLNDPIDLDLDPLRGLLITLQTESQLGDLDLRMLVKRGSGLTQEERNTYAQAIRDKLNQSIPSLNMHVLDQDLWRSNIELFQPIWLGGKLEALNRSAALNLREGREEAAQARDQVVEETVRLYLLNQLLEEVVAVHREVEQGITGHLRKAESLYNAGLIAKYQLLRAKVAFSDAEKARINAEENRLTARRILARLLQVENESDMRLTTPLTAPPAPPGRDAVLDAILQGNSLLKTIAIKKELVRQKKRADLGDYLPQIYAFGKYEILKNDLSVLDPHWAVGAGLRFNLFSSGEKIFRMKADNKLIQEVDEKEREVREMLKKAGDGLYQQAHTQSVLLDGFSVRLEEAGENLRLAESRFSSGLGISLEVVDAHMILQKVKTERLQAMFACHQYMLQIHLLQQNLDRFIKTMEEGK